MRLKESVGRFSKKTLKKYLTNSLVFDILENLASVSGAFCMVDL